CALPIWGGSRGPPGASSARHRTASSDGRYTVRRPSRPRRSQSPFTSSLYAGVFDPSVRVPVPRGCPWHPERMNDTTVPLVIVDAANVVGSVPDGWWRDRRGDRKSTRLNSSHVKISYAVFCLKKKKTHA